MIEGRLFCILPGCSSIWFSVKNNNLLVITPLFVDATFFITKDTICTVTGSKSCLQLSLHGWRLDTVPLSDAFGFLEVSACLVSLNSSFTASWYVEKDLPFEFNRFCRHGRQGEVLGQELVHTFCISDSCSLSEYSLAHFLLNVRPCCVLFPLCMWCLEIITLHSKAKVWKGAGQISHTVSGFILGSATIDNKIDILWGSPSHATVVFMGVLKIINISLKRGKYKIDIKRVNHINYNQLFQSWDLKSEKVVFVFILKLRLLNSFIKWYEDRFLPQLVLHDGSLNFSLPLVLYLW